MSGLYDYAKDRDRAFVAFVHDGDFAHVDKLAERWGLAVRLPHNDVGRAAIYKAVQECVGIAQDVKAEALAKCVELGFSPFGRGEAR